MGAAESTERLNGTGREEEKEQRPRQQEGLAEKATKAATIAAGVAVAAWGISKLLSQDDDDVDIKAPNPSIRESIYYEKEGKRSGYRSTKGQSSGYGGISQDDGGSDVAKKPISIWSRPPPGCFKMNTDGACRPNPGGLTGLGGILRNDKGDFVCCFYGFIGKFDSDTAEIRGVHEGLKLLERRGLVGSVLETDSQTAYQWIEELEYKGKPHDNNSVISLNWETIEDCRRLKRKNNISIEKIDAEDANRCADKLAKMGRNEHLGEYMEFRNIPPEVKRFIDEDKNLMSMGC